jgi:general stress protein 13
MKYFKGDIIEAKVNGISKYGIFVVANDNYTGLIHISEISTGFVRDINDYVSIGEEIICEVLDVDYNKKQLNLSIKNINYKLISKQGKIRDKKNGFKPLQMQLPIWMREKLKELDD